MNFRDRLQRCFKPRFAVIYPFGIFVTVFCYLNEYFLKSSIILIVIGVALRLWANSYAIKNDKLTTSGPYAFVRNPLYLGTFFIAIGFIFVLTTAVPWWENIAGGMFLLALCLMYYRTINTEEGMLREKFKDAFSDYCQHVPALIPTFIPYKKGEKWPFSFKKLSQSKEYKVAFWIFVILTAFYLKTHLLIEHKNFDKKCWDLATAALFFIILDATLEFNKKNS
ncbi:MAG: isoprenylcysteine carboxylmethyltransferase family protein [Candidatus Omnitrophica bacterium]|nr:isoprenylcysteine carboxylmethyltransferase family protein [Candidatus Omnitrophota bacterium]